MPLLADAMARRSRGELLAVLEAQGIPAGPINDLAEVFADPQVRHRGLRIEMSDAEAEGGTLPGVRTPMLFSASPLALARRSPRLGEHTAEVHAALAKDAAWPTQGDAA